MAKAPKAPGDNGVSTPAVIFDAFDAQAHAVTDGYWRAQVRLGATVAASKLLGAERVAPWIESVNEYDFWRAEGLAKIAEGRALAGDLAGCDAALAASREALQRPGVDGERGTLAWRALAFALRARGDEPGVDAALAAAVACARRDKVNPSQPWPHLVRAYTMLGRDAELIAHFGRVPGTSLSFEDATAAQAVVSRAVERGDLAGYRKWRAALAAFSAYETHNALRRSALAAVQAGHGEALFAMVSDFAEDASYGDYVAWEVCETLAGEGHLPLARRILQATVARFPRTSERLTTLANDLGTSDDLAALRAHFRATEATLPALPGEPFVRAFRARYAIDPESALRLVAVREAELRAQLDAANALTGEGLVTLGVALASVGQNPRGLALLDEAVKLCAGLKGRDKASSLEFVGSMLTDRGFDAQALVVLRKMTSKYHRTELSKRLSLNYVRARDYAGAVAVVGLGEERPLSQAMRLADALAEAAGVTRAFMNFA